MDVILNRTDGIVEIDGTEWMTREKIMSSQNIRKSSFYNQVTSGQILSQRLFLDKKTVFYVYRMNVTDATITTMNSKEVCHG